MTKTEPSALVEVVYEPVTMRTGDFALASLSSAASRQCAMDGRLPLFTLEAAAEHFAQALEGEARKVSNYQSHPYWLSARWLRDHYKEDET